VEEHPARACEKASITFLEREDRKGEADRR